MLADFAHVRAALLLAGCPAPLINHQLRWVQIRWTSTSYDAMLSVAEAYKLFDITHRPADNNRENTINIIAVRFAKFSAMSLVKALADERR